MRCKENYFIFAALYKSNEVLCGVAACEGGGTLLSYFYSRWTPIVIKMFHYNTKKPPIGTAFLLFLLVLTKSNTAAKSKDIVFSLF